MRIAHLLMVHAYPEQAERLVKRLLHPDADIYVHVDKKVDEALFNNLKGLHGVNFIKKRAKVYWAAYSQVEATLNGFREILASGKTYHYINFITGQDYPLKPISEIHSFFALNPGKAFMHALPVETDWIEAIPRFKKYHLVQFQFRYRYKVQRFLNRFLPARQIPNGLIPMGRSAYFTITPQHAAYILNYLDNNWRVRNFFLLTWGPDEFIFQTLLCSSPYKADVINDNLRYIDWSRGGANPKILTLADADALLQSGKLFARKFSLAEHTDVLDFLDRHIQH